MKNPIMKYFKNGTRNIDDLSVCTFTNDLAHIIDVELKDSPEKSAGLRKLLEAKDCFVRASIFE